MKITPLVFALTILVAASPTKADSTITVGVRAWANQWTTWDVFPPISTSQGTYPASSENFTSGSRVALTPTLSIRINDFLVSGSVFSRKHYSFQGDSGLSATRKESDLLIGYYVLPTFAVTLGQKYVEQDFSGRYKYSGPIVGATGSAPLTGGFSMYGTLAIGRLSARIPVAQVDAQARTKFNADYLLSEVGIAYPLIGLIPGSKATTLTMGYRNQVLATKGYSLSSGVVGQPNRSTELRDTTEGLTIGISVSF